jgi:hypothetical protein
MIAHILTYCILFPSFWVVPTFMPGRWALLFVVGLFSSFLFTLALSWRALRKPDRPGSIRSARWGATLFSAFLIAVIACAMWAVFHDPIMFARPILASRMVYVSGSVVGCALFVLGWSWSTAIDETAELASAKAQAASEGSAAVSAAAMIGEWRALLIMVAVMALPFVQWHAFMANRTMASFFLPLLATVSTILVFGGLLGRRSVVSARAPKGPVGAWATTPAPRSDRRVRWTVAIAGTIALFLLPGGPFWSILLLLRGIFLDGWALFFAARGAALIRDHRFGRGAHLGLWWLG